MSDDPIEQAYKAGDVMTQYDAPDPCPRTAYTLGAHGSTMQRICLNCGTAYTSGTWPCPACQSPCRHCGRPDAEHVDVAARCDDRVLRMCPTAFYQETDQGHQDRPA